MFRAPQSAFPHWGFVAASRFTQVPSTPARGKAPLCGWRNTDAHAGKREVKGPPDLGGVVGVSKVTGIGWNTDGNHYERLE
jgi:hypothetical protein